MRNCASQMTNLEIFRKPLNVIASGAKQSSATQEDWIASLQELLAMTELATPNHLEISLL
jgi:hypothetical protein